ncbi:MAG: DUF2075 domain-containing protein [Planctomycetota bacterium]
MQRYFYSDSVDAFRHKDEATILGQLAANNSFALDVTQRDAWVREIVILKGALQAIAIPGHVYFEYSIPRLGRRADAILLLGSVVFVLEFKVREAGYPAAAVDQVWDYALDLKNFHETSHRCLISPVLVSTEAGYRVPVIALSSHNDRVLEPILCNADSLSASLMAVLAAYDDVVVDPELWEAGRYSPSPTIIEAATALYNGHSVEEISRSDAGATNLTVTSQCVEEIIEWARENRQKAICFVTGVPGAGKTLVGLNVATQHTNADDGLHSVFLSGNGPLVSILREALARNTVAIARERGEKKRKGEAQSEVKMFIQNVHHFRDECLVDVARPPIEHVAIFDEAQRAWNLQQTAAFMSRKKGQAGFSQSEPEFLISCLDRHPDWAVVVCLVGGGQEINTGEAGIAEWIESVLRSFPQWQLFISSRLVELEYAAGLAVGKAREHGRCSFRDTLHLSVSMRSFRAENVSQFVKHLLDLEVALAREAYRQLAPRYPLVITRDLGAAKRWLREQARGSERFGIVVSSQAQRLKPQAIDVRTPVDPIHWFLGPKTDVRSSYYLEDVATEFQVQGLELDWTCVTWDADFRHTTSGWGHFSFVGDKWNRIHKRERQEYLKNAYRVLLTRARQGMVIVVPHGAEDDPTRSCPFYDQTFEYLQTLGIRTL